LPESGYLWLWTDLEPNGSFAGTGPRFRATGSPFSARSILETPFVDSSFRFPPAPGGVDDRGWPSMMLPRGRIYKDGSFQLVTLLQQGGTGAGTHQLAFVGTLRGL
jgi:hypothetical protein